MLFLNSLQVFPALAAGCPAITVLDCYIAKLKQLVNCARQYALFPSIGNNTQGAVQVISNWFHSIWDVPHKFRQELNNGNEQVNHGYRPLLVEFDSLWNLLTKVSTGGFSYRLAEYKPEVFRYVNHRTLHSLSACLRGK